jgi:formylglycine-generating enzyme required for sulfatase activity
VGTSSWITLALVVPSAMTSPRVLISYSHDSPEHVRRVLRLADTLREQGVDARLDQYTPWPRLGWPHWMLTEVEAAAFIVCVCTPTYKERFEQRAPPGEGLGASWEGFLAELAVYGDRDRLGAFVPVLLEGGTLEHVPQILQGQSRHSLPAGHEGLLRHLLQVPEAPMPPLGPLPKLTQRSPGLKEPPTAHDRSEALTQALAQAMAREAPKSELDALRAQLRVRQPHGADLNPGDVLGKRFHLKRRLGHGGIATVWSAVEPLMRGRVREVAIKVLHLQHLQDNTVLERFRKGGADHAQVDDPSVVRVFEPWGEADGRCWIVMELLTGGDLDQRVKAGELEPLAAVRMCLEVGRTIARLHARQLIHADVKPANILLDGSGAPKVADFDLAKNLALSEVGTTRRFGNPLFSCQEQADGEEVTPAWDVYGISATALWCASGGVLTKVDLRKGRLPKLLLPAGVMEALRQGAATEVEARTPSMEAWCAAVERGLAGGVGAASTGRSTEAVAKARVLVAGERRRFELPGGVPLELAYIPAGTFWRGSPEGVGEGDEHPQHEVTLTRSYWMGVTPVTQAQWAAVAPSGRRLNPDPSHFKGAERPVERVSWDDARAWCNALSSVLKRGLAYPRLDKPASIDWTQGFRLPTEAEWERACRAGTDTAWSFGDDEAQLKDHAWYDQNSGGETHPVGQLKPNSWGLHDLHGNVWEWCWDAWLLTYTSTTDPVNPPTKELSHRCRRGGAFNVAAEECWSDSRDGGGSWGVFHRWGFRVVLPAPARDP